jgi:hypothetical protein
MGFWAIGRLQTTQDQARIKTGIEAALEDSSFGQDFESLISGVQKRVFLVHDIHRKAPALVHSRFAMSYLRGPLTRNEIEVLVPETEAEPVAPSGAGDPAMVETASARPAPPAAATTARAVQSTPPPLPAPLQSRYLNRNGGNIARPHLWVKAAVRYKVGQGSSEERVHSLAFHLDPEISPSEVVATEPIEVDEAAMSDSAPAAIAFGELPDYIAINGVKAIEKALRERLDDRFAIELLYDPATKLVSRPDESADAFATRVADAPTIANKRRTLESRLQSKRATLASKEAETKARGMEKWASLGTSILANIGILSGRKRTVTGVGGVLSKQRMESTARSMTQRLQNEIADLEGQLQELSDIDPLRFETRAVKPARSDVAVLRYDILWIT